jgi:glycosyl hydrolase family 16
VPRGVAGRGEECIVVKSWRLIFEDRFDGPQVDPDRWVTHYLPQWTVAERSAARYDFADGLRLRIDADQPAWRPEDGELRVSNLQTGVWSGPIGSRAGTHRHRDDLAVMSEQPRRRLFLPTSGRVEATLRASDDPTVMLAFWLVGFEENPADSGEICVAELFGSEIASGGSGVNVGIKAHHDPQLVDDMEMLRLDIDASSWHSYAAEWTAGEAHFFVDDERVRTVQQGVAYPMQLMLDLFEFPGSFERPVDRYPKVGEIRSVRGYVKS